jgi:hypothetical protein
MSKNETDEETKTAMPTQLGRVLLATAAAFIAKTVVENAYDSLLEAHRNRTTPTEE